MWEHWPDSLTKQEHFVECTLPVFFLIATLGNLFRKKIRKLKRSPNKGQGFEVTLFYKTDTLVRREFSRNFV